MITSPFDLAQSPGPLACHAGGGGDGCPTDRQEHPGPGSHAGRASYLTLWPMTRREQRGLGCRGLWEELLGTRDRDWLDLVAAQPDRPEDWRVLARRGGFPVPAVHLKTAAERVIWFDGYVRTYLERDVQEISAIAGLPDFRLMQAARLRLGGLVHLAPSPACARSDCRDPCTGNRTPPSLRLPHAPPNTAPGPVFFTKEHRVMFSGRIVHRAKQLPQLPRRPRVTAPVLVQQQPRPRRRLATLAGRPPTRRVRHHPRRLHPGLPPGLAGPPPARRDQVEKGCTFPPRGPVRYRSTGAHRPEPCDRRLSSRPALPSSSYRSSQRRNVRSQTPSKRAASSCVRRLSVQPPDASSNRAIRGSGHHAVRLLRYILLHPMKTGQILGYKTGQIMGSLHPQDRGMH